MKINPEIEAVEYAKQEKQVRELTNLFKQGHAKMNNRKTTRGRKRQTIHYQIKGTFPPIFKTRTIIH